MSSFNLAPPALPSIVSLNVLPPPILATNPSPSDRRTAITVAILGH
jgi:hypothetical protein